MFKVFYCFEKLYKAIVDFWDVDMIMAGNIGMRSAVFNWMEESLVWESLKALCCVIKQDTLSYA